MATYLKSIVFFILLVLILTPNSVDATVHVRIYNMLAHNLDLKIHCKSKDDDLGVHLIHLFDFFEFSFNKRVIGGTLFFCDFSWKGALKRFDIYKQNRDDCLEDLCYWDVLQDKVCMILGPGPSKICYPYN